jgi:tetratricopeptide (TPR) repeat protein
MAAVDKASMSRPMKPLLQLVCAACAALVALAAFVLARPAHAADTELSIELPNAELLLPPVSPPQLQKEGLALPGEAELVNDFLTLVGSRKYEAALDLVKEEDKDLATLLTLLEAGDPLRLVQPLVVPGGLASRSGGDTISATLLYLIGHAYFALERYVPAETAFKNALIPLPDYLRVHESLGLLYLKTERYDEAREHLTRAAELGLHTGNLYAALGYLNQQTHNYWGAASAFARALVMDANESWQRGLLYSLVQTRQYSSATALVEQMLQNAPDDPDLWLYRSQTSLGSDQRALALSSLETAIRLGDDSVANKQVCATLHMEMGSVARAVELLMSAYSSGLEFQFVDQAFGWLVQQGEWDYLRQLLASVGRDRASLTPEQQSKLLRREADLQLHDGERQAAVTALQDAVELDPTNAEGLMALGRLYREDRDYNRAELVLQRASVYDLYRESAQISLAQLAIDQENYERALDLLRDVVRRNPGRTDLRRNIDSLENLVLLQTDD